MKLHTARTVGCLHLLCSSHTRPSLPEVHSNRFRAPLHLSREQKYNAHPKHIFSYSCTSRQTFEISIGKQICRYTVRIMAVYLSIRFRNTPLFGVVHTGGIRTYVSMKQTTGVIIPCIRGTIRAPSGICQSPRENRSS